jgi:hypothetical protein
MYVPVPRSDAIEITDSSRADDFAALARALAERGGVTLVYGPSTTTINNSAPATGVEPVDVRMTGPAVPLAPAPTQPATSWSGFTLGDVIAYSGATLMGGAVFSELVTALLPVPMLVPVLGGVLALVGMLAALGGAGLDLRERHGGAS